jgi:hypothetical protein
VQRRSFLASILALGAAPAIVKVGSLMRINPQIITAPQSVLQNNILLGKIFEFKNSSMRPKEFVLPNNRILRLAAGEGRTMIGDHLGGFIGV